jgi:hypothetical protein
MWTQIFSELKGLNIKWVTDYLDFLQMFSRWRVIQKLQTNKRKQILYESLALQQEVE